MKKESLKWQFKFYRINIDLNIKLLFKMARVQTIEMIKSKQNYHFIHPKFTKTNQKEVNNRRKRRRTKKMRKLHLHILLLFLMLYFVCVTVCRRSPANNDAVRSLWFWGYKFFQQKKKNKKILDSFSF